MHSSLDFLGASLRDDPLLAFLGCATLIPVCIWIVGCISWMVMGDMEPFVGIPSIFIAIFVGYVAMDPPTPEFTPLALASTVFILIVFPSVRRQLDRRENIKFDIEQVERAYKLMSEKPTNAFLKFKLAEALYARGMLDHAHAIAQTALPEMSKALFAEEHKAVGRWKRGPGTTRNATCLTCGRPNPVDAPFCTSCGAAYLSDYARGKWMGSNLAKKLVAAWVTAVVAVLGVPYVMALELATPISGTLIGVQLVLAGWMVWNAFTDKAGRAG